MGGPEGNFFASRIFSTLYMALRRALDGARNEVPLLRAARRTTRVGHYVSASDLEETCPTSPGRGSAVVDGLELACQAGAPSCL